jgi:hypothetical protein
MASWGAHRVPDQWLAVAGGSWLRLEPFVGDNRLERPVASTCWAQMNGCARPYVRLAHFNPEALKALPTLAGGAPFSVLRRIGASAIWVGELDVNAVVGVKR